MEITNFETEKPSRKNTGNPTRYAPRGNLDYLGGRFFFQVSENKASWRGKRRYFPVTEHMSSIGPGEVNTMRGEKILSGKENGGFQR